MEEMLEIMLAEYTSEVERAKDNSRVSNNNITYWQSKALVLQELKKRSSIPWECRSLIDYES